MYLAFTPGSRLKTPKALGVSRLTAVFCFQKGPLTVITGCMCQGHVCDWTLGTFYVTSFSNSKHWVQLPMANDFVKLKKKCLQKGGPRKLPLCNREVVAGRCSRAWRSASPTRGDLSYHPLGFAWVPYFLTCYHTHGSFLSPVSYASELSNYFYHFAKLDFIYSVENPTMKYQEKWANFLSS